MLEGQGARRTGLDTFPGHFLESVGNRTVQRRGHPDVKSASDECQPERFSRQLGDPDADAAQDALARLEHDLAPFEMLFEGAALRTKPARLDAVQLAVMLQLTVSFGTAVAVQTTARFAPAFESGETAQHALRRGDTGSGVMSDQEKPQLGGAQPSHHSRKKPLFAGSFQS